MAVVAIGLAAAASAVPVGAGRGVGSSCAYAAGARHVALVVQHGGGAVVTRCVGFDAPSLTGEQVLQMSGVPYQEAQYGGTLGKAVCQIDGEPQTFPPGCFSASSPYWVLFVSRCGGNWSASNLGVSSQTFRDGDAEGWRYDPQTGSPPPPPSPAGVCDVAAPAPNASAAPPPVPPQAPVPVPKTASASPDAVPAVAATPAPPSESPPSEPSPSPSSSLAPISRPASSPFPLGPFGAVAVVGLLVAALVVQVAGRLRR